MVSLLVLPKAHHREGSTCEKSLARIKGPFIELAGELIAVIQSQLCRARIIPIYGLCGNIPGYVTFTCASVLFVLITF